MSRYRDPQLQLGGNQVINVITHIICLISNQIIYTNIDIQTYIFLLITGI